VFHVKHPRSGLDAVPRPRRRSRYRRAARIGSTSSQAHGVGVPALELVLRGSVSTNAGVEAPVARGLSRTPGHPECGSQRQSRDLPAARVHAQDAPPTA
jgi:hypothetical protein